MPVALNKPFRILSLDGGGARGVFQAAFLARLHDELAANKLGSVADNFQLIAGTSTGSIVGMALALGIDPHRIVDFYRNEATKIFVKKGFIARGTYPIRKGPRYDQLRLKNLLSNLFENKQLGQAKTRILVTACSLDRFSYRTFTNIPELGSMDNNLSAVDVVLASAAAPTYFKSHRPQNETISYVDGGLWANSPSLISALCANKKLNQPFENIRLLSVSTGDFPRGVSPDIFDKRRPVGQIDSLFEIMFSCQSNFADDYAGHLLGKSNVIRISTPLDEIMPLDDAEGAIAKLPALANIAAQKSLKDVLEMLTAAPPEIKGEVEIMGTKWRTNWYFEDGTPYVSDEVTFNKWLSNTQFEGYGEVVHHEKKYRYSIIGEVSRTGVVVLVYKAERFPTEANIGTACLQLSMNAQELKGTWGGFASRKLADGSAISDLRGGKIEMQIIKG